MRAVIICGGAVTDYEYIKAQIKRDDFIICADSGYDHAVKMRIKVDILIGDFDSIQEIPKNIEIIQYPIRKDYTDSEIAINHAREIGYKDFLLLAATGTRLDHTLTNILLLKDCLDRKENMIILDEHNKIMITDSVLNLLEPKGSIISLIPISECRGVTTHNLDYPLINATLYAGKSLGVSNIAADDKSCVTIEEGILIVIIAKD